jgi:hypothetical protein
MPASFAIFFDAGPRVAEAGEDAARRVEDFLGTPFRAEFASIAD